MLVLSNSLSNFSLYLLNLICSGSHIGDLSCWPVLPYIKSVAIILPITHNHSVLLLLSSYLFPPHCHYHHPPKGESCSFVSAQSFISTHDAAKTLYCVWCCRQRVKILPSGWCFEFDHSMEQTWCAYLLHPNLWHFIRLWSPNCNMGW